MKRERESDEEKKKDKGGGIRVWVWAAAVCKQEIREQMHMQGENVKKENQWEERGNTAVQVWGER